MRYVYCKKSFWPQDVVAMKPYLLLVNEISTPYFLGESNNDFVAVQRAICPNLREDHWVVIDSDSDPEEIAMLQMLWPDIMEL